MKSRKFNVFVTVIIILMVFAYFEFLLTSRINIKLNFIFPSDTYSGTIFNVSVQNEDGKRDFKITPNDNLIKLDNTKHGNYNIRITLDEMSLFNESFEFSRDFSFLRENFGKEIVISDISTITSVDYSVNDPWLRVKWFAENLGDYQPIQYRIKVFDEIKYLNVNYFEIDVRKYLKQGFKIIPLEISPVSKEKNILALYRKEVPVDFKKITLDMPPQFDSFEISLSLEDNQMQINPYDLSVEFPVMPGESDLLDIEILYQKEKIYSDTVKNNSESEILKLPTIPYATVTNAVISEGMLNLDISLDGKDGFLQDFFSEFILQYGDDEYTATSTISFLATSNTMKIFIAPRFELGIPGSGLLYIKPEVPVVNIETTSDFEAKEVKFNIYANTTSYVQGRMRLDRGEWESIAEFKDEYERTYKMDFGKVHLIEIELTDELGQTGSLYKWIDPNTPQIGFFKDIFLSEGILNVEWGNSGSYEKMVLIVSDGYNMLTIYPDKNKNEINLKNSVLRYPVKVILKGLKNEQQYTYAISENISPE